MSTLRAQDIADAYCSQHGIDLPSWGVPLAQQQIPPQHMAGIRDVLLQILQAQEGGAISTVDRVNAIRMLGEPQRTRAFIGQRLADTAGALDRSVVALAFDAGDANQQEQAIEGFFGEGSDNTPADLPANVYRKDAEEMRQQVQAYQAAYKLEGSTRFEPPLLPALHAVQQLRKKDYDLVLGIVRGGVPLATLFEMHGDRTRYIEHHRSWKKRPPIWRKIGRDVARIREAKTVLVCENDAVTGNTLGRVHDWIRDQVGAEAIDICFTVGIGDENLWAIAGLPEDHYREAYQFSDFTGESFVQLLQDSRRRMRAAVDAITAV